MEITWILTENERRIESKPKINYNKKNTIL